MKQNNWKENSILLYGPSKAGTTLLKDLIDGNDELITYPTELKFKYFLWIRGRISKMQLKIIFIIR